MLAVLIRFALFALLAYMLVRAIKGQTRKHKEFRTNSKREDPSSNLEDTQPMNLSQAYALLEVDEQTKNETIESQYRRLLAQYHPDKVSHLGDDLRKVADKKTRAFNEAYELIKANRSGGH